MKYTHDEVLNHAKGFAAALIQSGLKRGEVVAIVLPNCPEYASVMFGRQLKLIIYHLILLLILTNYYSLSGIWDAG